MLRHISRRNYPAAVFISFLYIIDVLWVDGEKTIVV